MDQTLQCRDCPAEFIFTDGEAAFYAEKNLSAPKRCKDCRLKKRDSRIAGGQRQMFDAVCSDCGEPCQVPFQPQEDKEVFCANCFVSHKVQR
ncbi:zinc-ribbon domain containing protein [Candidatus Parcubacteria bacterium]|nr:zinc-ribbon domain containing protein [Candidatus Parcubacteria bacterium]